MKRAVQKPRSTSKRAATLAPPPGKTGGKRSVLQSNEAKVAAGMTKSILSPLPIPDLSRKHYAPPIRAVFEQSGKVNVRALADVMDVSVRKVASGVGVTEGAVRNKPDSDRAQPGARKMVDAVQRAFSVIGDWKDTMIWLRADRGDLSGRSPLDLIIEGRGEIVDDLITNIESGQAT